MSDFNGDGDQDLAVGYIGGLSVLLGGAGGGFGPPTNYELSYLASAVTAADFNGDGHPDLAVTGGENGGVSVLLGDAHGGFGAPTMVPVEHPDAGSSLAVEDFDGDGDIDLAVGSMRGSSVSVLRGDGAGGFTETVLWRSNSGIRSLAVSDFNGDGDPDLAASAASQDGNDAVYVWLGGAGGFASPSVLQVGFGAADIAVGDFNSDDRPDLATAILYEHTVSVLLNTTQSAIAVEPSLLTFPAQRESTVSAARTVRVSSTGEWPLRVRSVKTAGAAASDYLVTADSCSGELVELGDECTIEVRFAPQRQGSRPASLRISSDAAAAPLVEVALDGRGAKAPGGPADPHDPGRGGDDDAPRGRTGSVRSSESAADEPERLAELAADRLRAKRGQRLRLRYVTSDAARVTVEVRRGRRLITRSTRKAAAGTNRLVVRAPRARGRYTLSLTAVAGTSRATDKARLTVS